MSSIDLTEYEMQEISLRLRVHRASSEYRDNPRYAKFLDSIITKIELALPADDR